VQARVIKDFSGGSDDGAGLAGSQKTYSPGTPVSVLERYSDEWSFCTLDDVQTYVPNEYISDGKLNRYYNPTELDQKAGDVITIFGSLGDQYIATNQRGQVGWIPMQVTELLGSR